MTYVVEVRPVMQLLFLLALYEALIDELSALLDFTVVFYTIGGNTIDTFDFFKKFFTLPFFSSSGSTLFTVGGLYFGYLVNLSLAI